MESKKRRLAALQQEGGSDDGGDGENKVNVFLLTAQHKSLATNLFAYKRRIEELEARLSEQVAARVVAEDALSLLGRHLDAVSVLASSIVARLRSRVQHQRAPASAHVAEHRCAA